MKQAIKKGIAFGLTASLSIGFCIVTYGYVSTLGGKTSGNPLTSSDWNSLVTNMDEIKNNSNPTGMISAFNGVSCPTGWTPANGGSIPTVEGGTNNLDLRGRFLRGMNSFENGTNATSVANGDASGPRTLANYQADDNKAHSHAFTITPNDRSFAQFVVNTNGPNNKYGYVNGGRGSEANISINSAGTESHPRNVAVIYCVKN